jgi:hypothetical protein
MRSVTQEWPHCPQPETLHGAILVLCSKCGSEVGFPCWHYQFSSSAWDLASVQCSRALVKSLPGVLISPALQAWQKILDLRLEVFRQPLPRLDQRRSHRARFGSKKRMSLLNGPGIHQRTVDASQRTQVSHSNG